MSLFDGKFCPQDDDNETHESMMADEITRLREQLAIAVGAINETIEENLGLADGDNCTLIKLKKALAQIREMGDV